MPIKDILGRNSASLLVSKIWIKARKWPHLAPRPQLGDLCSNASKWVTVAPGRVIEQALHTVWALYSHVHEALTNTGLHSFILCRCEE